jgi:hypothetical protein
MSELVRLDIANRETAQAVLQLQRLAYRVEAELIGSDGIPPLWETLEELRTCGEDFLGALVKGHLVGAIPWRFSADTIHIHRLVVNPDAVACKSARSMPVQNRHIGVHVASGAQARVGFQLV